jgi:hypothetical protein
MPGTKYQGSALAGIVLPEAGRNLPGAQSHEHAHAECGAIPSASAATAQAMLTSFVPLCATSTLPRPYRNSYTRLNCRSCAAPAAGHSRQVLLQSYRGEAERTELVHSMLATHSALLDASQSSSVRISI